MMTSNLNVQLWHARPLKTNLAGRKQPAPFPQTAGTACVPAVFISNLKQTAHLKSGKPHSLRCARTSRRTDDFVASSNFVFTSVQVMESQLNSAGWSWPLHWARYICH